ncbi:MAG: PAS domain-containing protein [Myxococcales bacterium]|nr:PAS domain-containing protein [Myxococcales bacterium]
MKLGVRGKLFLASLTLILVVVVTAGAYLSAELRQRLQAQIEKQLERQCRLARQTLLLLREPITAHNADAIADRIGDAAGLRVTLIDASGRVLGDSQLSAAQLATLPRHDDRPEVQKAFAGKVGLARRDSATLGKSLIYMALAYQRAGGERGVIRVATTADDVNRAAAKLRVALIVAGLFGLGAALLVGALASHFFSRALRQLVEHARALVRGRGKRIVIASTDELGHLAGSLNTMADEIERTVGELSKARDRYETVLEAMSEAVIALDAEKRILLANQAARAMLQLPANAAGQQLVDLTRLPALHDLVERGTEETTKGEFDLAGEPKRTVFATSTPMSRAGGGTVIALHEVTEMRRLERVRRDFVANVSHELRTPVSIIRANAETLLGGALEDEKRARAFLDAMLRNSERLSHIIADLLDLSRIEAGRVSLEPTPVLVRGAARRAMEVVQDKAERRQLTLSNDVDGALLVHADPKSLDQVLLNLLENAVKYTTASGHVSVEAAEQSGPDGRKEVRIAVRDNGPGIEPRHRSRIFERFYRVDPGRSRDMGGTGLGLAIVKHLVEASGGRVGFSTNAPRGSVFWFTLPAYHEKRAAA